MSDTPRSYRHRIWTNERWSQISPRADDIVIATGYRAGTTWMQRICSLLIFQRPDLEHPLHYYSPWVELELEPVEEVARRYAAQSHRRFFKTHTPFDGLPRWPNATYVYVARDPRDVVVSLWHQLANVPAGEAIELPRDFSKFLRAWLTSAAMDRDEDGWPYWSYFRHARSFWAVRDLANIQFFHYHDLCADLRGQMQRLAGALDIEVADELWPTLVDAASFAAMRSNSAQMTPHADSWRDSGAFFRRGTSGQWRELFTDADRRFYAEQVAAKLPPALSEWLHREGLRGFARAPECGASSRLPR